MAEYDEKNQQATPRKRQKAKEQGQIPRSNEVVSMAAMAGAILTLFFGSKHFMTNISSIMTRLMGLKYGTDPLIVFRTACSEALIIVIPFFVASSVLAIFASLIQGGFSIKPFKAELNKINPFDGIMRIFSKNSLFEFMKSFFKFSIGVYFVYYVIKKVLNDLPLLMTKDINVLANESGHIIMKVILYGFLFLFVIALFSYFIERWRFEQSLKMSQEEIKEELKETEGDPLLKSRIKSIQREMARKRMMQEVPKATVVITNPTHIAVALKYDEKSMSAPQVIAKGIDFIAEKIKEIAKREGIPIVEDKPLAQTLSKIKINEYIPEELYKAVAKILAHIYKLGAKGS
jgi:flagellar biosynthetic protein FlhB